MNSIKEYNGLKLLTGINTHPGSGTIEQHQKEIDIFNGILDNIDNKENPVMIELGCFWAVWSLMFKDRYKNGRNILIELGKRQLLVGEKNFQLNNYDYSSYHGGLFLDNSGTFMNRNADLEYSTDEDAGLIEFIPNIHDSNMLVGTELDFVEIYNKEKLDVIDLLHMDIQGSELKLMYYISDMLISGKVINLFIATHSDNIHSEIVDILRSNNYNILINEPFGAIGGDGLLYAKKNKL